MSSSIKRVQKVTKKGGVVLKRCNERFPQGMDVPVPEGSFLVTPEEKLHIPSVDGDDWNFVSSEMLAHGYRPIGGQAMGEDGLYQQK